MLARNVSLGDLRHDVQRRLRSLMWRGRPWSRGALESYAVAMSIIIGAAKLVVPTLGNVRVQSSFSPKAVCG